MPTRYKEFGYWEIASRQMSIVTKSEQLRFKDAKITVSFFISQVMCVR